MAAEEDYSDKFSEDGFWGKLSKYAKKIGSELLEIALKMYYALQDSDTPLWAKSTIIGALGYLISPLDIIPDVLPVVGYTDDMTVLAAAAAAVAAHIKQEHKDLAKQKLKSWFG